MKCFGPRTGSNAGRGGASLRPVAAPRSVKPVALSEINITEDRAPPVELR